MKPCGSRQVILVLVALAVGTGSLLVPEPASAELALFRVERQFYGSPQPPATSPGGAGRYIVYIEPYVSTAKGVYNYPPATAIVQPGNPIGGAFTLPTGFIDFIGNYTLTAMTGFPGYTSVSGLNYYNGPGRFGPNHGAAGPTRIVFPTTGPYTPTTPPNPTPNPGVGNPVTPTTTFGGRYDFSRAGSINVIPGPNRFGGTMQWFYRPEAFWYQYISYWAPAYYKAYGSFRCQNPPGVTCTTGIYSGIGDVTSSGMVTRFLLNVVGTGTGYQTAANTAKATTPTTLGAGTTPTVSGNASYVVAKNYYLHTIHPWTTGFGVAHNPLSPYPPGVKPQLTGYDTDLLGADLTVTRIYTSAMWDPVQKAVTYTQTTYKQYLMGVERVVSMVRPRLKHVYMKPVDPGEPIVENYASAQAWTMRVFFLPEPAGMLLLGAGIAALLGLSRIRRR